MSKPIELNPENFIKEVLNSPEPVLVDFWAPWCGPCQMMAPVLDELAGELAGKVKVAKVNVDDPANRSLAEQYGINGIPNLKIFKDGKEIKDLIGFRSKEVLKEEVKESIR